MRGMNEKIPANHVYLIGELDTSVAKIGHSRSIALRLATIQAMSPVRLHVLAVAYGNRPIESALHKHFAAFRIHGEWFDFGDIDRVSAFLAAVEEMERERAARWGTYMSPYVPGINVASGAIH